MTQTQCTMPLSEVTAETAWLYRLNKDYLEGQLVFFLDVERLRTHFDKIQKRRAAWLRKRQERSDSSRTAYAPLLEYLKERLLFQQKLVQENLALVNGILHGLHWPEGISYDELEAEGQLALVIAARHFDGGRNIRFSSFAYQCVRNALIKRIDKDARHIRNRYEDEPSRDNDASCSMLDQLPDIGIDPFIRLALTLDLQAALAYIEQTYQKRQGIMQGLEAIYIHTEGIKYCEIARRWGMPENHLTALVSRTKSVLRKDATLQKLLTA